MWKTLQKAFKVKEVRDKLIYTFLMLVVIRIGSQLPVPGVKTTFFAELFARQSSDAFGFFNTITGGSFTNMSIFALSITPYITSSIIMQLLTIAIPKLEEMQKEGEEGRKKIAEYTRYVTVGLALMQSIAMSVGFGGRGLLIDYNIGSVIVAVVTMTAGSAMLMWIGEQITTYGVGNGISIVLLFNIISSVPNDVLTLYERFIKGKSVAVGVVYAIIIAAVIIAITVFTIYLQVVCKGHLVLIDNGLTFYKVKNTVAIAHVLVPFIGRKIVEHFFYIFALFIFCHHGAQSLRKLLCSAVI